MNSAVPGTLQTLHMQATMCRFGRVVLVLGARRAHIARYKGVPNRPSLYRVQLQGWMHSPNLHTTTQGQT